MQSFRIALPLSPLTELMFKIWESRTSDGTRAEEMLTLIDEVGKIADFDYSLMLKALDYVLVRTDGKLTFIFQSGIRITL